MVLFVRRPGVLLFHGSRDHSALPSGSALLVISLVSILGFGVVAKSSASFSLRGA